MDTSVNIQDAKVSTRRWLTNVRVGSYNDKTGEVNEYSITYNLGTGLIVGAPQGTDEFTSDQLHAMNLEGLYEIVPVKT